MIGLLQKSSVTCPYWSALIGLLQNSSVTCPYWSALVGLLKKNSVTCLYSSALIGLPNKKILTSCSGKPITWCQIRVNPSQPGGFLTMVPPMP
ncbi:hypothetical protein GDO81_020785 [Engystomops pustulosus]|uniref:Uncharacterized protein n=1 Tax=Engystomops pustulosus TaxID=76066 RepID=A0AAV6Z7C8_ENGPU|nr:hypothetical protein GDO81_020785 [Engystomops pustulosus]